MPTMKGTHGTMVARAGKGRRGSGIYFWAESSYSRDLAI